MLSNDEAQLTSITGPNRPLFELWSGRFLERSQVLEASIAVGDWSINLYVIQSEYYIDPSVVRMGCISIKKSA
ncbi:hypothetical protein K1719_020785 [Acacia pycnantha]|nr:hypothetical protein K1719_020785 [Acacia pycnantha]